MIYGTKIAANQRLQKDIDVGYPTFGGSKNFVLVAIMTVKMKAGSDSQPTTFQSWMSNSGSVQIMTANSAKKPVAARTTFFISHLRFSASSLASSSDVSQLFSSIPANFSMPFHNATKGNVMMTNTHNKILLVTGFQNTTSRTRIITPIGTSKEPQNILNQNYVLSLPLAKITPPSCRIAFVLRMCLQRNKLWAK